MSINPPSFSFDENKQPVIIIPKQRQMEMFSVNRNELDAISLINTHMAVFSSIGSFFLSLMMSSVFILASWNSLYKNTKLFCILVGSISLVFAIIAFIFAGINKSQKNGIITRIENETKQ